MKLFLTAILIFLLGVVANAQDEIITVSGGGQLSVPRTSINSKELGVLVNAADPQSVAVAKLYIKTRKIPSTNVVRMSFPVSNVITPAVFNASIKPALDKVPAHIQGYAISWSKPWKVGGMSMTSAVTLGYDIKYTNTSGGPCGGGFNVNYYQSTSVTPFTTHGIRPSMMLAGESIGSVEKLIYRGLQADRNMPVGDGHFVRTNSAARSARRSDFQTTVTAWNKPSGLRMFYHDFSALDNNSQSLKDKKNVLFYLTSYAAVGHLSTIAFERGAVADHFTSYGGVLFGGTQMSALRWLEAGAIASYGTITEPCAIQNKFPRASVLVSKYFGGGTVLEAYWKSVSSPGEGLFIGDPLARPFGTTAKRVNKEVHILTTILKPSTRYAVYSGTVVGSVVAIPPKLTKLITFTTSSKQEYQTVVVPGDGNFYKLVAE